jgi:hypothetical protein
MQNGAPEIPTSTARLLARGASPEQIAVTAVSTWLAVSAALSPIIGERGVAALYKRSLYLSRIDYPWLAAAHEGERASEQYACLQAALSQQTSSNAAAANAALLQTFHDLLTDLIGGSLTERLLRSVWDNQSSGDAVQDTSS